MAKSSSFQQTSHPVPKNSLQATRQAIEKTNKDGLSQVPLDFVNLFNPPKSNPNGRLASSKLFYKDTIQKLALSSSEFQKSNQKYGKLWWISSIFLILLVNIVSTIVISRNKFSTSTVNQDIEKKSKILAGKTDLTAQEFITPNLNSLSRIPTTSKNSSAVKSDTKAKVSLPLAIPPTNLPNNGIIHSDVVNTYYYYIVAEYTGEKSLLLAQKQVENVSLVNFPQGVFIYLGAFSEKNLAQNFINNVKEEGLNAYIYSTDR